MAQARERARESGMAFIHPFDDPDVVAGQGTVGLELLEQVPDLAKVVVCLGGGGTRRGRRDRGQGRPPARRGRRRPGAGRRRRTRRRSRRGIRSRSPSATTIADGIALRRPGDVTFPLVRDLLDDVVTVGEDDIAEAMVLLLERARLVVEGAGAVGVAALLTGAVKPAERGTTCAILSGGNADAGLLASVTRLHESRAGRRLVLFTRVSDRPGGLAAPARRR